MKNYKVLSTFFKPSKLSASAILVLLSATLVACGQTTDINTSEATDISTEQSQPTAAISATNPNANLLKNVSATVYKDANCGCCKEWINHAADHGMSTIAQDVTDLATIKDQSGVPSDMRSCHTAVTTDGYVFEGHVPAKYVAQFLANPPAQALGLAMPGMPMGSPGMEYQDKFDPYQIMQMNKDGSREVYASVDTSEQQL